MHHYRIIHKDDAVLAATGKHTRAVASARSDIELDADMAGALLSAWIAAHFVAFPVVIVDSIGEVLATDVRRF